MTASKEALRLLTEKVLPSIEKYNAATQPVMFNSIRHLEEIGFDEELRACGRIVLWDFVDRVNLANGRTVAANAVGTLGVNEDSFWVINLHYALYQGIKSYTHIHGDRPVDFYAYLLAMLTSARPDDEIRNKF